MSLHLYVRLTTKTPDPVPTVGLLRRLMECHMDQELPLIGFHIKKKMQMSPL